jgi:hypothetical protein
LVKRAGERESSYQERLLIQSRGFEILEKIGKGVNVSTKEINAFRVACYNHEVSRGKRVVNNTYGPMDAVETLDRLLTVLDYKSPQMIFKYQDVIVNPDVYEDAGLFEPSGTPRKPGDYRTIEEAKTYSKAGTLTLSAYPYLNGSVTMNALLKDFWKEETLDEYFVKHIDKENGTVSYRKYKNVERKITLDLEKSEMPKVLLITIQQLDGNRASITRPDEIYPSGIEGIGPRYKLASGIEHMPGHYVAHVATANGIVQANDGWVHPDRNSSFPGYGYVYVLDNS